MDSEHEDICNDDKEITEVVDIGEEMSTPSIHNDDKEFPEVVDIGGEMSISSIHDKSLPDEESLKKASCDFGDNDCGEAISVQRIVLDFTPIEDLDNDDVQRKCCEFWDFVNSRPELNCLIVKPRPKLTNITRSDDMTSTSKYPSSTSVTEKEETALSVLEFVEEKGLTSLAFNSKIVNPFCDEELKDYCVERVPKSNKVRNGARKKTVKNQKTPKDTSLQTFASASIMCEKLNEWDLKHPKSFSPPGPVPNIEDSVLNCKTNL